MRTIFHVDMDAFFVSVEEVFDPSLKGKPVIVGGQPDQRGVVSAASYAARKFGVHSAMPLRKAFQLCPHGIFVDGHPDRYRDYSRRVRDVLERFTPQLEMASIDEAYLDVTGTERLHGHGLAAAHKLHEMVKAATTLNCSIGVASTRMVAKVASDQAKPNGILWIQDGLEASFLAPLEVRKLPGVGKVTDESLRQLGIRRVRDLAGLDERFLRERFGEWGASLAGKSKGQDAGGWYDEEIGAHGKPKSISHEHTFGKDTADAAKLEATLAKLSEMVGRRLREHSLHARTVQLKLRYTDFTTITRAKSLDHATQLDTEIYAAIRSLLHACWNKTPVRLLGVHTSGFEDQHGQLDLLDDGKSEKWRRALTAADKMREKFGEQSVGLATGLSGTFRERTHEALPEKWTGAPATAPDRKRNT